MEALFNKASSTYESILGTLGHTRPPIEDATARLLDRSTYLGNVLTGDPSLKDKIKQSDLAQVRALSLVFLQIQDQLQGPQRDASDAFLKTAAMMGARPEWPPPPEN